MNADTVPDPVAACRRVAEELDRPRWRDDTTIRVRDARDAIRDALYGEHRTDNEGEQP